MKKIKRSISILLIAMMALAMLGGCGNNSTSGNSTADGDSTKIEKTADAGEAKGTESNPFILGVSPMSECGTARYSSGSGPRKAELWSHRTAGPRPHRSGSHS